jgi:hypothetical protein
MVVLVLFLSLAVAGGALGSNPTLSAGGGGLNVLNTDRSIVWSQPPNLDGLILSSEVIADYGLESELADDFNHAWAYPPVLVRWWAGYFSNNGCGDFGSATRWNLRVYEDGGCVPGNLVWEQHGAYSYEYAIYCQGGAYPIFQYEAPDFNFNGMHNTRYWFSAQACDHDYPPQVGRLAAAAAFGCESCFRSTFFSFPNWVPATVVFGQEVDASLEFETYGIDGYDSPFGACCLDDQGSCRTVRDSLECVGYGGVWHPDQRCDGNVCEATPVRHVTWGQVKSLFR